MTDDLIILAPSPLRRAFALVALAILAGLCFYLVLNTPFTFGVSIIGLAISIGAVWCFMTMYRGTAHAVELRSDGLYLSDDTCLARLTDMEKVDRGTFSIKPTNGFTVILKEKMEFAFVPGLYWRTGRKLGLGGVTAPHQGRYMAEVLMQRINDIKTAD